MTLMLLGFNILLLVIGWKFMIRKTILDHTRDKLFDLRDELRHEFVQRGWDMNSALYKELRDTINAYLRYTEHYSVWRFFYMESSLKKNKPLCNYLRQKVELGYRDLDAEKVAFAKKLRIKSQQYMMDFSVYSSGLLLVISFILVPFFAAYHIVALARRGFGVATNSLYDSVSHFGRSVKLLWMASVKLIGRKILAPELFETTYARRVWSC